MLLKLVIVLKDYSQTLSLDALIAGNPHCFNAEKQLRLVDLQKPIAIHIDASITTRMRKLAPKDTELTYHVEWIIDELHKLGLPKDNIVVRSSASYMWNGDENGNELGFVIKATNTDSPLKKRY
ncbi:TPA: hypothetical protein ACN36J_001994 [Vibrio parahaemolyticus]